MSTKIEALYSYLIVDTDGTEGIPAMRMSEVFMPLLGADEDRVRSLRSIAQDVANERGLPVTLARFTAREDLEIFRPRRDA